MERRNPCSRVARCRWGLRLAALAAAVGLVPACKGGSPTTPLTVTFLSPVSGAASVPREPVIYLRFDRALNPTTVNSSNFVLADSLGLIAAGVSYVSCMNEVRMVPGAVLASGTLYRVTLTNGITDSGGMGYAGGFYQFTTITSTDVDRPAFSGAATAGSPTQTTVDLTWSAATDSTPGGLLYDVFLSTASGCYDFTAPYASVSSATGTTVSGLAANTVYYFVARARDVYGNTDLNELERSATTLP